MSPNPIMGEQPVEEARKSFKQGVAAGLGMRIFPDVKASNIAWLMEDAERRKLKPGEHLSMIIDTFRVMQTTFQRDPGLAAKNLVRDSIPLLADLPTAEERACPVCGDDFKGFPDDKRCPTCQKAIDDASDDAQVTP